MPQLDTKNIPFGDHIAVGMCTEPKCSKLHIILFDENEKPIATAAIDDTVEFIETLQRWAYIAATRRDG